MLHSLLSLWTSIVKFFLGLRRLCVFCGMKGPVLSQATDHSAGLTMELLPLLPSWRSSSVPWCCMWIRGFVSSYSLCCGIGSIASWERTNVGLQIWGLYTSEIYFAFSPDLSRPDFHSVWMSLIHFVWVQGILRSCVHRAQLSSLCFLHVLEYVYSFICSWANPHLLHIGIAGDLCFLWTFLSFTKFFLLCILNLHEHSVGSHVTCLLGNKLTYFSRHWIVPFLFIFCPSVVGTAVETGLHDSSLNFLYF